MRNLIPTSNGTLLRVDVSSLQSTLLKIKGELTLLVEGKRLPASLANKLASLAKLADDAVFGSEQNRKDNELLLLQQGELE